MPLTTAKDLIDAAVTEIAQYRVTFILSTERMLSTVTEIEELNWSYIPYGSDQIDAVPNDQRGLYAFVVCNENGIFPPHHYVMYVGIAGKKSNRSLRDRYNDYLDENSIVKRPRIARLIVTWKPVLRFYYAPVDDTVNSDTLEAVEVALNGALMPPFSKGDLEIDLKRKRSAFQ